MVKWGLAVCVFSVTMTALVPSKQDAMFIAGGVGVIEAAKAVKGSDIAKTSVKIVEHWLNKQLQEDPSIKKAVEGTAK